MMTKREGAGATVGSTLIRQHLIARRRGGSGRAYSASTPGYPNSPFHSFPAFCVIEHRRGRGGTTKSNLPRWVDFSQRKATIETCATMEEVRGSESGACIEDQRERDDLPLESAYKQ